MLRLPLLLMLLALLLGGCSWGTGKPQPAAGVSENQAAPAPIRTPAPVPETQPTTISEPIASHEALAATTAAYAQELLAQFDQARRGAAMPPATAPAVRWIAPPQTQPVAPPAPMARVTPTTQPADSVVVARPATRPADPAPQRNAAPPPPPTDQLEAALARRIEDSPGDVAAHLEYQVLQWLRGREVPQMQAIAALSAEDRELLSAVLDALSNFRASVRGQGNLLLSQKARPLLELADRLRPQTSLSVGGLALCQKVYGFGAYDPLPASQITAGREVVVYAEIQNFASRLNDRNMWQTDITQQMVLYNDRGQQVAAQKREAYADLSRNRRRDFCVARKMVLPPGLPAGQYSLTVTICDQQANRVAEATLPVRIGAPAELRLARPE